MDTIQLIVEISILKEKMDKAEAFLEELVEYLLVTCKDDDYITPEVICRKLAKYGYIELENGYWVNPLADRKTENSSEKANNCKAQTETKTETQNSNKNSNVISVYDGVSEAVRCAMCSNPNKSDRGCDGACSYDEKMYKRIMDAIGESRVEDEPQTETEIAKAIVHKMIDDAVIAEDAYPDLRQKMHDAVDEYEPQTERSE